MTKAMNVSLRQLKKSDLPYFLKWWKDKELIALTSGVYEKSEAKLTLYFFDFFNHPKDHHYIISCDRNAIGHIALTHKSPTTFESHIVIGEKEYWGQGIGTKAIIKALKIAFTKLGYTKATLEVRPNNLRAINAYEACGFVKKGLKKYPQNPQQPVTLQMQLISKYFL